MHTGDIEALKAHAATEATTLHAHAVELSDWLHAHPETSFEEHEAVRRLVHLLTEERFAVQEGVAGLETAFHATYSIDDGAPHVAYLAEYDALPDLGHACGHNLIAAASWGAAVAVARTLEAHRLPGTVHVFGTPGQELYSGKATMVDAHCFDGIDAAMLVHPDDRNILDPLSMALHELEASFRGASAHAAEAPHEGRNALNAVLIMFRSIDALRQHVRSDVRIHGIITDGGTVAGIVPEFAQARFACRAHERQTLDDVTRRVRQCAEAAALATDTELALRSFEPRVDNMVHDGELAALFRANWELHVDAIDRGRDCEPLGALDTGNVSHVVPTIQPMVAAVPHGTRHHTKEFADAMVGHMAHAALRVAMRTLAMTGIDILCRTTA